jgi:hypothetical protein
MKKIIFLSFMLLILCHPSLKSQIFYFDINPDVVTEMSSTVESAYNIFPIDFNNDGTEEYDFRWDDWGTDWFMHFTFNVVDDQIALDGTTTNMYGGRFIKKLASGDPINGSLLWDTSYPEPFIGESTLNSNFLDQGDKYIGVKFKLGTNIHYGWVLVNFQTYNTTRKLIIKSYAYNGTPNAQIAAGQISSSSVDENNQAYIGIYPNPVENVIQLNTNLETSIQFEIYNSIGQKIAQGATTDKTISITDIETGIYFIRLSDAMGNTVSPQKLVKR